MFPHFHTIAWDLDGTLYPAVPELNAAVQAHIYQALAEALVVSHDEAVAYFDHQKQVLKSATKVLDSAGIDGQKFFIDVWMELPLEQYIQPNPELAQLFAKPTGVQHIMLTNSNTEATVRRKLECVGISIDVFSAVLTSVGMGVNKPDRRAFEILIETTDTTPENILYVGDRIDVDLAPAKELGIQTCLISDSSVQHPAVDFVFARPSDVLLAAV